MKNIGPNIWRSRLNETDWNFLRCPSEEVEDCLNWELKREYIQAKNEGKFPTGVVYAPTPDERRMNRFRDSIEDIPAMLKRLGRKPKGGFVKVEWPSYLERRSAEKWKPVEKGKPFSWEWLETDWYDYFFRNWDELREIVRTLPRKLIWLPWNGNVELCPLTIDWERRDEELVHFFREWLKERRPRGEAWDDRPRVDEPPAPPKSKGGAGVPVRQAKANLKALAAWRLIQHYHGNYLRAYAHSSAQTYLGRQFEHAGAWSEARLKVQTMVASRFK